MFRAFMLLAVALAPLTPSASSAEASTSRETHCVLFVVDQAVDGEFIMSEPVCFDNEASADVWAVTDPQGKLGSGSVSAILGGYVAASTFTLGKHYDGAGGTGSSITIVGGSCTGGYWNTPSSWDNRISSSYNGCAHLIHWDWPNKSGSSQSTYGSGTTDNLGYMNNRTESVSYHSS